MAGGFPLSFDICNGAGSSGAIGVAPSNTANTKGSFVQIIASTASDSTWMTAVINMYPNNFHSAYVDIAIGGAGSETVIVSNLGAYCDVALALNQGSGIYSFPISIPSGTRISARSQANNTNAGTNVGVCIQLFDGAFSQSEGYAGVDSIGATTSTTLGTTVDPGAVLNTKGAYAQLTASTAVDYVGLMGYLDGQNTGTAASVPQIDIAIGGSGSEKIIIPDFTCWTDIRTPEPQIPFLPILIPSGTRIAARAQSNNNTLADRTIGLTLYGVYQ